MNRTNYKPQMTKKGCYRSTSGFDKGIFVTFTPRIKGYEDMQDIVYVPPSTVHGYQKCGESNGIGFLLCLQCAEEKGYIW